MFFLSVCDVAQWSSLAAVTVQLLASHACASLDQKACLLLSCAVLGCAGLGCAVLCCAVLC